MSFQWQPSLGWHDRPLAQISNEYGERDVFFVWVRYTNEYGERVRERERQRSSLCRGSWLVQLHGCREYQQLCSLYRFSEAGELWIQWRVQKVKWRQHRSRKPTSINQRWIESLIYRDEFIVNMSCMMSTSKWEEDEVYGERITSIDFWLMPWCWSSLFEIR